MTGRPWLVWVEGVAGSGKTALLRKALAGLPDEFVTVRASADKLATDVPYELAAQLGSTSRESPFTTGQELLGHLVRTPGARAGRGGDRRRPLGRPGVGLGGDECVKRLDRDRVVVIVTSRPSPEEDWDRLVHDEERCRRLSLGQLQRRRGRRAGPPQRGRTDAAPGRTSVAPHRRAPDLGPDPAHRAVTSRSAGSGRRSAGSAVSGLGGHRPYQRPPLSARDLAAALAVVNQRVPLPVVGRVAGIADSRWMHSKSLQATGFVRYDTGRPGAPIEFSHPLYRLAVYEDLSPIRRRDLHRSAARVLTPDSVLAHRVAAADGADDALADELEAAADARRKRPALWPSPRGTCCGPPR